MNFILKIVPIAKNNPFLVLHRLQHWNKDYIPGPLVETQKHQELVAKKYNLLPTDYKPYADDGLGYGDYPHLPDVSVESLNPYYPYDYPESKRNHGEPVHAEIDLFGEHRYGTTEPLRFSLKDQFLSFALAISGSIIIYYYLDNKRMFRPVLPRQYPGDGKIYYTFEPKKRSCVCK